MKAIREFEDLFVLDLNEALRDYLTPDTIMGKALTGIKSAVSTGAKFAINNPMLAAAALTLAVNKYEKYVNSQRYLIKLFGKTAQEKKTNKQLIDTLIATKKFKVIDSRDEKGGRLWVLRRLGEGQEIFESELADLKKNKKALSPTEKKEIIAGGGTWEDGSIGIWRSEDKDGKTVFVCNTHRCYQTASTIPGALKKFKFVKTTS